MFGYIALGLIIFVLFVAAYAVAYESRLQQRHKAQVPPPATPTPEQAKKMQLGGGMVTGKGAADYARGMRYVEGEGVVPNPLVTVAELPDGEEVRVPLRQASRDGRLSEYFSLFTDDEKPGTIFTLILSHFQRFPSRA